MTSPYSTRSRKTNPLLQTHSEPPKSEDQSPKTTNGPSRATSHILPSKSLGVEKQNFSTPQLSRSKRQALTSTPSNHEVLNLEHSSSLNNESCGVRERSRKNEVDANQPEHNVSSMGLEQNSPFGALEVERQGSKRSDDEFINEKKSYRTQYHRRTVGVPYRKCHSTMEEKVVGIINKINSGKECQKEIQTLMERVRKITIKEMMNRYFVSGVHVIHRLVAKDSTGHNFDAGLATALNECLLELHKKIEAELDCSQAYRVEVRVPKICRIPKDKLVARLFSILRKTKRLQKVERLQELAIEKADWFLENDHNNVQILLEQLARC